MTTLRRSRTSRSLSPPKVKNDMEQERYVCDRCQKSILEDKKDLSHLRNKSQQTKITHENQLQKMREDQQHYRYSSSSRRPSTRQSYLPVDTTSRSNRQMNLACAKHEKEKMKMQATIEKLQEAFCEKESKLQDTKTQLVRERRMSEIMERQLKNARNLSEQMGRIIHDREEEIRSLKNVLNRRQDAKNAVDSAIHAAVLKAAAAARQADKKKILSIREEFQAAMRRNSLACDQSEYSSLCSSSIDKMLKEVHSLIDGLRIKDEAIKGLQEECTRRLDKIQTLQRSIQILQEQLKQTSHHHSSVCTEKDNMISQLQHALKETEATVENLLSEKTKVALDGENTIQELQEVIQQKDLVIKRIQTQLDETIESKGLELFQLRESLQSQQEELDAHKNHLEAATEDLFRSQRENESLRSELRQEKCNLSKMSDEVNSLVDKLTKAAAEIEMTKLEYQRKDEKLINAQHKIKDLYMSFFGDRPLTEKLKKLCETKREFTCRKVLSEEDILVTSRISGLVPSAFRIESKISTNSPSLISNSQIHKQQLSELQQQVNESQTVCGILQEQLKEVTDFLDQLLHIEISPKNIPALSMIRQYGNHLPPPANVVITSKERVTPEGISSNSQLDVEDLVKDATVTNIPKVQRHVQSTDNILYSVESYHGSMEKLSQNPSDSSYQNYAIMRSHSAEDIRDSQLDTYPAESKSRTDTWSDTEKVVVLEATDSDEILLLLNERDLPNGEDSCTPQPHHLNVSVLEYQENSSTIEKSVSFGSYSDSVLMSFDRGSAEERRRAGRRVSTEMLDIIQIVDVGQSHVGINIGSSDSDIWSEPDLILSRKRMGVQKEAFTSPSGESPLYLSEDEEESKPARKNQSGAPRSKTVLHIPVKKNGCKLKRWLCKLKSYLQLFEETNSSFREEVYNLCEVKTQLSDFMAQEKIENGDIYILDVAEYIRLNYILQKKIEKTIHYNRQLIEVFAGNVQSQRKKVTKDKSNKKTASTCHRDASKRERKNFKVTKLRASPVNLHDRVVEEERLEETRDYESTDIQSQLIGYHATLLSCQEMIKDLHSQLKERHCSEMMNKHELNKTVYGYLEDIDTCIDELCKKMETNPTDCQDSYNSKHGKYTSSVLQEEVIEKKPYGSMDIFPSALMEKLKENEERLLRFEVLLNEKEKQLKMSAENAVHLEVQLNGIKQSLYEIQLENQELKECLEFSENKQLEMEGWSNQMLKELQETMQRLSDLEERFRCLAEEQMVHKDSTSMDMKASFYPVQYKFHSDDWQEISDLPDSTHLAEDGGDEEHYEIEWESENY